MKRAGGGRQAGNLEDTARKVAAASGTDKRTSFFAGAVQQPFSTIHYLQEALKEPAERVEQILTEYVSDRFVDYFERRLHGLTRDVGPSHILFSQGYKRGQEWRGVPIGKTCWDICIYQQLLQELRPKTVIELGAGVGGSALFFIDHCRMFGLDAKFITLDINKKGVRPEALSEKSLEFIEGSVADIARLLPIKRLRELPHPWLVIEDTHVEIARIVEHLEAAMEPGDYLIVEDNPNSAWGSFELEQVLRAMPRGTFAVDTHYTDMFGRNATCSPDAIFKKLGKPGAPAKRSSRKTSRKTGPAVTRR